MKLPPAIVSPILTLTTDFGTRDAYVAAMKGVILGIAPAVHLVDISHEISPQDVMEAAFVLREAVPYFPPGTTHLAVVDPGVGTARAPVALRHGTQRFVGPDNGLFALLLEEHPPADLVVLDRPAFWRTPAPSQTFHGRDLFAPVAAHLAAGRALHEVGSPCTGLRPLRWAAPALDEQSLQGWIVHQDRFGNSITNISQELFARQRAGRPFKCFAGNTILTALSPTYATVDPGEPLLLFGSSGFLEIAVNAGNAAELLNICRGTPVHIVFLDEP